MYDRVTLDPPRASTAGRVADALRAALMAGDLAPGTPLREVALAGRLGVARSTVREALTQLVAEGLATREPHRGVSVTRLTADDVRDVTRARRVLELAGVRAWPTAGEAERATVDRALTAYAGAARAGAGPATTEAHLGLHRAIAGLTGSRRLDAVTDGLAAELRLALATVERRRRNARQQVAEHRALVELLRAGRVDAAASALADHLDAAERSLLDALAASARSGLAVRG